jgi:hypothetical protein
VKKDLDKLTTEQLDLADRIASLQADIIRHAPPPLARPGCLCASMPAQGPLEATGGTPAAGRLATLAGGHAPCS